MRRHLATSLAAAFLALSSLNSLAQQPSSQPANAQNAAAPTKILAPHKPVPPLLDKPIKGLNPPMARSMVGGLWMTDANYKSSIYLRNNVETDPIAVTPILYLANGNKYALPQVTVPAGGNAIIDINDGLQQQGISSWATLSGYFELDYNWAWDPFCATIRNVDTVHSTIFTYGLTPALPPHIPGAQLPAPVIASNVEGMWWKHDSNVTGFVSVANLTGQPAQATISTTDAQGKPMTQHDVTISPHGMKLVNLDELLSSTSTQGGVVITANVPMDKLAINGGLQNQAIGYSAILPLTPSQKIVDPKPTQGVITELGIMTGAADPMMNFPAGTTFTPYSVLRNISDSATTVTPTMWWMDQGSARSAEFPSLTIAPHQTQSMDVHSLVAAYGPKNFNGSFNLVYTGDFPQGTLILASGSVDQTGTYVFEVMAHGTAESLAKSLQYWSIGNGDDTMVTVWNPADEPQDFVLTLHYTGGQYALPLHLAPRATRAFNMSQIVETQVPDANGNVIPASVQEGSGVISGPQGLPQHILVAVDAGVYNVRKATCGPICETCYGASGVVIVDSAFYAAVQQTHQQRFYVTWGSGSQSDATSSVPWSSSQRSVATVNTGLVSAIAAGATGITAYADEYLNIGQFCYGPGYSYPCPSGQMNGSSTGNIISVQINNANIVTDNIQVTLSGPAGFYGNLSIVVSGPNGQAPVDPISTGSSGSAIGAGTYTYSFQQNVIPIGEYTQITASWNVQGISASATYSYHFKVLGTFVQTQYNTPSESQCTGSPQPITVWSPACKGTNTTVISGFDFRVTNPQGGTGSGHSINWGDVSEEFTCSVGSGDLRSPFTITGTLGGLSNSTVAACSSNPDLYVAGAQVYIQGEGVKTVTDRCPACCLDGTHLDNFNTSTQCSGLSTLPSALTVRLY